LCLGDWLYGGITFELGRAGEGGYRPK